MAILVRGVVLTYPRILRFEQFDGLVILLKRIDKLKFYPLGILKEITVKGIMLI